MRPHGTRTEDEAARAALDPAWAEAQQAAAAVATGSAETAVAGILRAFDVALQKTFVFTSRDLLTLLRGEGQLEAHLLVRRHGS